MYQVSHHTYARARSLKIRPSVLTLPCLRFGIRSLPVGVPARHLGPRFQALRSAAARLTAGGFSLKGVHSMAEGPKAEVRL